MTRYSSCAPWGSTWLRPMQLRRVVGARSDLCWRADPESYSPSELGEEPKPSFWAWREWKDFGIRDEFDQLRSRAI